MGLSILMLTRLTSVLFWAFFLEDQVSTRSHLHYHSDLKGRNAIICLTNNQLCTLPASTGIDFSRQGLKNTSSGGVLKIKKKCIYFVSSNLLWKEQF